MSKLGSNKKIIISVSVFVAIMLCIVIVLLIINGKKDDGSAASESTNEYSETVLDNSLYETDAVDSQITSSSTVSTTLPTTSPAMDGSVANSVETAQIEAFLSGKFYMKGAMVAPDGTATDMDIAMNKSDFEISMNVDGLSLSVLYLNKALYLVNLKAKTYIELSSVLMSTLGIDSSEFEEMSEALDFSNLTFDGVDVNKTELDGSDATMYHYYNDSTAVDFYFVDNNIKLVNLLNSDGSNSSSIEITEFSPAIPANMLTLTGFTKSSMMSFIGSAVQ